MNTYTAIFKLHTTLDELAAECLALFGEGARLDAEQEETTFARCNTPVQHGYIRIIVEEHIATALEWMQDNGITSEHGELIRVEWHGQNMVLGLVETIVGYEEGPDTGEPEQVPIKEMVEGYVREPFQVGTENIVDMDGPYPVYLGTLS